MTQNASYRRFCILTSPSAQRLSVNDVVMVPEMALLATLVC